MAAVMDIGERYSADEKNAPANTEPDNQAIQTGEGGLTIGMFGRLCGLVAARWQLRRLSSRDPQTRCRALAMLARSMNGDLVLKGIEAALRDAESTVRQEAAKALGTLGSHAAAPSLEVALEDTEQNVRLAASHALGSLNWVPADARQRALFAIASSRFSDAVTEGEEAVEPLAKLLQRDASPLIREAAANALGKIGGSTALDALLAATKDDDRDVKSVVAMALGKFGDHRAVEALFSMSSLTVGSPAYATWGQAAKAALVLRIGELKRPEDVTLLVDMLQHQRPQVRDAACAALTNIGDAAQPALVTALRNYHAAVRSCAATVLGRLKDPSAMGPLTAAVRDQDSHVRAAAVSALEEILGDQAREIPEVRAVVEERRAADERRKREELAEQQRIEQQRQIEADRKRRAEEEARRQEQTPLKIGGSQGLTESPTDSLAKAFAMYQLSRKEAVPDQSPPEILNTLIALGEYSADEILVFCDQLLQIAESGRDVAAKVIRLEFEIQKEARRREARRRSG